MTWALVTTMPGSATQPEPSTPRPQALPRTRTTERSAPRTSGSLRTRTSGGPTGVVGPTIDGAGSTRSRALSTGPVGGSSSLRLRMISERCTSPRRCGGARSVQGDGAEHPDGSEGDAGDERGAAGAVGEVQAMAAADHLRPQSQRHALQGDRDQRPDDQRPQRREQRRVRRMGPVTQHQRRQPAADEGPEGEPDQGQEADDQALPVAPDADGEREGDYSPVQSGQAVNLKQAARTEKRLSGQFEARHLRSVSSGWTLYHATGHPRESVPIFTPRSS